MINESVRPWTVVLQIVQVLEFEGKQGVAFALTLRKEFKEDASEGWKAEKFFGAGENIYFLTHAENTTF